MDRKRPGARARRGAERGRKAQAPNDSPQPQVEVGVRVLHLEARLLQRVDEVERGAGEVERALLVDDHAHAARSRSRVSTSRELVVEGELVAQTRAAAAHDLQAQAVGRAACRPSSRSSLDPLRGRLGHLDQGHTVLRSPNCPEHRVDDRRVNRRRPRGRYRQPGRSHRKISRLPFGPASAALAAAALREAQARRPRPRPRRRRRAQRVVAHHAALADPLAADLELRLHQHEPVRARRDSAPARAGSGAAEMNETSSVASEIGRRQRRRLEVSARCVRSSTATRGSARSRASSWP